MEGVKGQLVDKEYNLKYLLAEIAIDKDGNYWINYLGDHVDQGGPVFKWAGGTGSPDVEPLLGILKRQFKQYHNRYMELINEKESEK